MKQEFIKTTDFKSAEIIAPWASVIEPVENGFMAFEDLDEYHKWACNF